MQWRNSAKNHLCAHLCSGLAQRARTGGSLRTLCAYAPYARASLCEETRSRRRHGKELFLPARRAPPCTPPATYNINRRPDPVRRLAHPTVLRRAGAMVIRCATCGTPGRLEPVLRVSIDRRPLLRLDWTSGKPAAV